MKTSPIQQELSEIFDLFEKPPHVTCVKLKTNEVVCNCPLDKQPDFYQLEVVYQPDHHCITSHSFKRYIQAYQHKQYFSEQLASMIVADIHSAVHPIYCQASLIQSIREGVQLTAFAEIGRKDDNTSLHNPL